MVLLFVNIMIFNDAHLKCIYCNSPGIFTAVVASAYPKSFLPVHENSPESRLRNNRTVRTLKMPILLALILAPRMSGVNQVTLGRGVFSKAHLRVIIPPSGKTSRLLGLVVKIGGAVNT